ncbi:hypothetical protein YC2023_016730 [Brassica napus]
MTILFLSTIFRLLLRLIHLLRRDFVLAAVEIVLLVVTVGSAFRSRFVLRIIRKSCHLAARIRFLRSSACSSS